MFVYLFKKLKYIFNIFRSFFYGLKEPIKSENFNISNNISKVENLINFKQTIELINLEKNKNWYEDWLNKNNFKFKTFDKDEKENITSINSIEHFSKGLKVHKIKNIYVNYQSNSTDKDDIEINEISNNTKINNLFEQKLFKNKFYKENWIPEIPEIQKKKITAVTEILFNREDLMLALFVLIKIANNPYAWDSKAKIYFDNLIIDILELFPDDEKDKYPMSQIYTVFAYKSLSLSPQQKIKVFWSETPEGENAFYVNKQTLIYVIDSAHEDDYYWIEESERWDKVLQNKLKELNLPF